jgi:hypothetical protein
MPYFKHIPARFWNQAWGRLFGIMTMTMSLVSASFERRLSYIVRRQRKLLSRGARYKVTDTGFIVATLRMYMPKFPIKTAIKLIVWAFLFKAYVYADLGHAEYASRVAALSGPSIVGQAGAWILQPELATVLVADVFKSLGA